MILTLSPMLSSIRRFFRWLYEKLPEIRSLDMRDALLAKIVIQIQTEALDRHMKMLPLLKIQQIHPLNRRTAIRKFRKRVASIRKAQEKGILSSGSISNDLLIKCMPSVTPLRAVRYRDHYVAFEGNGRIAALQKALGKKGRVTVEVEFFTLPKSSAVPRQIGELRRAYGDL